MKNKILKYYIQNNNNKKQILKKINNNNISKLINKTKTKTGNLENYNKHWNHGLWLKKNNNNIFKKTKLNFTNFYSHKEPLFLKTNQHIARYKHLLNQFTTKNIYDYRIYDYQLIFSLSTTKKLNTLNTYNRFNNKKLNLNYTIFVVGGRKIVGEVKVIFIESTRKTHKVKCRFGNDKDITRDSVLIASETKIIGYTKYVFRSINYIMRAAHPIGDISKLEILAAIQENNNYKQRSILDYRKLAHRININRFEEFKQNILGNAEDISTFFDESHFGLLGHYNTDPRKKHRKVLNMSTTLDHCNLFIVKQLYRFVLHLYWKYITSELNIFMLQAHVRERDFAYKLKKLHLQHFKLTNKHIKDAKILRFLQPRLLTIFKNKDTFQNEIWLHKTSLADTVIGHYSWIRLHIELFKSVSNSKKIQQAKIYYFKHIKSFFTNFGTVSEIFDRNQHSKELYFTYLWTEENIKLLSTKLIKLNVDDAIKILNIQRDNNYEVPTFLESFNNSILNSCKLLNVEQIHQLRDQLLDELVWKKFTAVNLYDEIATHLLQYTKDRRELGIRLREHATSTPGFVRAAIKELEIYIKSLDTYATELNALDGYQLAVTEEREILSTYLVVPVSPRSKLEDEIEMKLRKGKRFSKNRHKVVAKKVQNILIKKEQKILWRNPLDRLALGMEKDAFNYTVKTKRYKQLVRIRWWKKLWRGKKQGQNIRRKRVKALKLDKTNKPNIIIKQKKVIKIKNKYDAIIQDVSFRTKSARRIILTAKRMFKSERIRYIELQFARAINLEYTSISVYKSKPFMEQRKYDLMCLHRTIISRKKYIKKIITLLSLLTSALKHKSLFRQYRWQKTNPQFTKIRIQVDYLIESFYTNCLKITNSYSKMKHLKSDFEKELNFFKNPKILLEEIDTLKQKVNNTNQSIQTLYPKLDRLLSRICELNSALETIVNYEMYLLQSEPIVDNKLHIPAYLLKRLTVSGVVENYKIFINSWLNNLNKPKNQSKRMYFIQKLYKFYSKMRKTRQNSYYTFESERLKSRYKMLYYQSVIKDVIKTSNIKTKGSSFFKTHHIETIWILNIVRNLQKFKTINSVNLLDYHNLYDEYNYKYIKNNIPYQDTDERDNEIFMQLVADDNPHILEIFGYDDYADAEYFYYKSHIKRIQSVTSQALNFNNSTPFVPKTSVELFLKKLIKNRHFDIKHVASPSFLRTPYIGVDFTSGLDLKFYKNPNKYFKKYISKKYISKKYIKANNYIYEPEDLTNLKAVSLCFAALHEKTNIDEDYISSLFTSPTSHQYTKKFTKKLRTILYKDSPEDFNTNLVNLINQTPEHSFNKPTTDLVNINELNIPNKPKLSMNYIPLDPYDLYETLSRNKLNSTRSANISLQNVIRLDDIHTSTNEVEFNLWLEGAFNDLIKTGRDTKPLDLYALKHRYSYNGYVSWRNKQIALQRIIRLVKKLPKQILLNILGFDHLMSKGVEPSQLHDLVNKLFGNNFKNELNTDLLKNRFNLEVEGDSTSFIKQQALRLADTSFDKISRMSYKIKPHWGKRYVYSNSFKRVFYETSIANHNSFYTTFDKFFYSKLKFTLYRWRDAGIKKDILWSRIKRPLYNFTVWPFRLRKYNKRLNPRRLQKKGIKLMTKIYSMCTLYLPFARHFTPAYTIKGLHRCSQKLIKDQPKLLTKKKPLLFKLLFNFKKHYLFITLLDNKNNIMFSLHTGLFLKFFNYKKSLKKSKSLKIVLIRYLRKLLMLSNINNFTLYVQQTSDQLNKLLQILQKPINHSFTDPLTGQIINEELEVKNKRKQLFNFLYIIFLKNKPYGIMKTKKTGRLKRKIRRLIIKANRIID